MGLTSHCAVTIVKNVGRAFRFPTNVFWLHINLGVLLIPKYHSRFVPCATGAGNSEMSIPPDMKSEAPHRIHVETAWNTPFSTTPSLTKLVTKVILVDPTGLYKCLLIIIKTVWRFMIGLVINDHRTCTDETAQ